MRDDSGNGVRTGRLVLLMIIVVAVLVGVTFLMMLPGDAGAAALDKKTKAAIIDSVRFHFDKTYVFPDVAEKMGKALSKNLKKGEYDGLDDLDAFARKLTEDMVGISGDRHIWVLPASEEEIRIARQDEPTDEDDTMQRLRDAYTNFGFERVERLDNNIGYLKFNRFAPAEEAGDIAVAALNFLANSYAIIIDLRDNGGGYPSMIQLISSYFFEEPVHLNNFYIRETDTLHQFWTQAHVQGPRLADKPLYVLTSNRTFSGAEEFTYNMKNLKRGTIIGETTGGGAHPTSRIVIPDLAVKISVPFGRAINPITGTNWEGTGVEPDIQVPRDEALDTAIYEAVKKLHEEAEIPELKEHLAWSLDRLTALRKPFEVDEQTLKSYAGTYGPRKIVFEDGKLYYQREGNPRYPMVPMSGTMFCFDDIDFFRLEVVVGDDGVPTMLRGHYTGGQTDESKRTE
jgi:hypothetical protein